MRIGWLAGCRAQVTAGWLALWYGDGPSGPQSWGAPLSPLVP